MDAGGKINMQHRLMAFVPRRVNGAMVVDLDVLDETSKAMRQYRANALILAMPQRSLEILAQETPTLTSPEVKELLKSVMPMPAYKTLAVYGTPWWHRLGITAGRSTTDLPIRQVYYMDSAAPPNTNSLMLATYADGRTQSFWDGLYKGPKFRKKFPITPNKFFTEADVARLAEEQNLAPDDFGLTLHALTAEMHQLPPDQISKPSVVYAKDWAEDPYGGGWHFWRPGIKVWEALPRVRQPVDALPVHICGKSYANQQGWVEGALTSAEQVMQKYFKLRTPAWLQPQDYFMGP